MMCIRKERKRVKTKGVSAPSPVTGLEQTAMAGSVASQPDSEGAECPPAATHTHTHTVTSTAALGRFSPQPIPNRCHCTSGPSPLIIIPPLIIPPLIILPLIIPLLLFSNSSYALSTHSSSHPSTHYATLPFIIPLLLS